jgi:hypothetical protein
VDGEGSFRHIQEVQFFGRQFEVRVDFPQFTQAEFAEDRVVDMYSFILPAHRILSLPFMFDELFLCIVYFLTAA